jgi:hypothetical protein
VILAAMIGYYAFAVGFLALVGYLTGRQTIARLRYATDVAIAHAAETKHAVAEERSAWERASKSADPAVVTFSPLPDQKR